MGSRSIIAASERSVHVSAGTAAVLSLARVPQSVAPTTAYLMVGGRCARDCSFCSQARSSTAGDTLLSRVTWPRFDEEEVLDTLQSRQDAFRRVCIQSTVGPEAHEALVHLVGEIRLRSALPIDVSVLPQDESAADALFAAGVDHIGLGLDAATPEVFRRVKDSGWDRYQTLITHISAKHPGGAAVHLIAGLGETEGEFLQAVQRYTDMGAVVGLFAFCPVAGTRMADVPPPDLGSYRRLQAASYLITRGLLTTAGMEFDGTGRLVHLPDTAWQLLAGGEAFRTSGCPDCNRPYYNERPGGPQFNYPRALCEAEAYAALGETGISPVTARS